MGRFDWRSTCWNQPKKLSFAEKLKGSDARMLPGDLAARGAKFETQDGINFKEVITFFQNKFQDHNAVQQLMPLSSMPGRQRWNIIFAKPNMVDNVIENMVKFPSMTKEEVGVTFTPVQRRATLITIPDATPDISDNEIRRELEKFGTVLRIWKQTWEGFPHVFNGKRLVTMFPSMAQDLPPYLLIQNKKISLSFKGKPVFCNICMKDTHRTGDCPSKDMKHCYLCGATDHQKSKCEKFQVIRRPRGRVLPNEIVDSDQEEFDAEGITEPWQETPEVQEEPEKEGTPPHEVSANDGDNEKTEIEQADKKAVEKPEKPKNKEKTEQQRPQTENSEPTEWQQDDSEPEEDDASQVKIKAEKDIQRYEPFKKAKKRAIHLTPEKKAQPKITPGKRNKQSK